MIQRLLFLAGGGQFRLRVAELFVQRGDGLIQHLLLFGSGGQFRLGLAELFVQRGDGLIQCFLFFFRLFKRFLRIGQLLGQRGHLRGGLFRILSGCGFRGGQLLVERRDGLIQRFFFFVCVFKLCFCF